MFVIRRQLTPREGAPANTRYNPDTDEVETSLDGGVTWTPNPGADPRVNPAYQLPPNTAPEPNCAGAAGMVEATRRFVNAGITGGVVAGIANILLTILLLPIGWMFTMITGIAGGLAVAGATALSAAFTEDNYDALLCLFLDNINSDGSVTAEQLDDIVSAAASDISPILVSQMLTLLFQQYGPVGMSNAGSAYADPDAECDACAGWCHITDFLTTQDDYVFGVIDGTQLGVYTPPMENALYFQAAGGGAYYELLDIHRDFTATYVSGVVIRGVVSWGNNLAAIDPRAIAIYTYNGGVGVATDSWFPVEVPDGAFELGLPVGAVIDRIQVGMLVGYSDSSGTLTPPGGDATLNEIEASGTGDNPLGEDNC